MSLENQYPFNHRLTAPTGTADGSKVIVGGPVKESCTACPCDNALPVTILGLDKLPSGSTISINIVIAGKQPEPAPQEPQRPVYLGSARRQ